MWCGDETECNGWIMVGNTISPKGGELYCVIVNVGEVAVRIIKGKCIGTASVCGNIPKKAMLALEVEVEECAQEKKLGKFKSVDLAELIPDQQNHMQDLLQSYSDIFEEELETPGGI